MNGGPIPEGAFPRFLRALPFWLSLALVPVVIIAARYGGWALVLPVISIFGTVTLMDMLGGLDTSDADPDTPQQKLFWYRLITLIWLPVQMALVYGMIWYVVRAPHLSGAERLAVFFGVGQLSGAVGIVYAHELMHQQSRLERWLGDLLMAMVLYGHFRTEHLLVHHVHVGTPRDAVTARYNEGFHRFFPRVLVQSLRSAWQVEKARLKKRGLPAWSLANPFWRYGALEAGFLLLAWLAGGWQGVGLFAFQALVAVWYLELTDYVEHYGLVRKHLGDGRYEPVQPHHSWNAAHRVSNWLLINLQRHSDHHCKPARRFPLLQNHGPQEAPQLPLGYPAMVALAMVPPLWRRVMNPRVRQWRRQFYPEISDWAPYRNGTLPPPR